MHSLDPDKAQGEHKLMLFKTIFERKHPDKKAFSLRPSLVRFIILNCSPGQIYNSTLFSVSKYPCILDELSFKKYFQVKIMKTDLAIDILYIL